MPTKNNLQVNKTLVQISNSKYKRSLKKITCILQSKKDNGFGQFVRKITYALL